ncbi:MAG: hypothetical protein AAFR21_08850 [Pseudomonadota bacterium]
MANPMILASPEGGLNAAIRAEQGLLEGLTWRDKRLVRTPVHSNGPSAFSKRDVALIDPLHSACFPCIPYFGRIYGGQLEFKGSSYPLSATRTDHAPNDPLHGEGWISDWETLSTTDQHTELFLDYTPRAGHWPFAFQARQTFDLTDDGLTVRLSMTNTDDRPAPAGLGLHPYFSRTSETTVTFNAGECVTPPGAAPAELSPGFGKGEQVPLPETMLDHSFVDFDGDVRLRQDGHSIHMKTDAQILHVFAPEHEDYVCLEPVTHLPGRLTEFGTASGGRLLAPNEALSISMTIGRPT